MRRSFPILLLATILVANVQVRVANAQSHDLTVRVTGINSDEGQVIVCLWRNSRGFPDCNSDDAIGAVQLIVPPTEGTEALFASLPTGEYAVSVLHDLNSDGRTDTNFLGIPREPVGASGAPVRRLGAPRFEDAKFQVSEPMVIDIELIQP